MEQINNFVDTLNGILFSNYTVYALLITGVIFTVWSVFGQTRALTHGVSVIRGKYDDRNDPGAINHFQALSAALSATVGLGNIGGVAVAVALGGPGAILWMWVIGVVGMALKMTEVTQSMLYRNTDVSDNPHGGPMFVVKKGLMESALLRLVSGFIFAAVTVFLTVLAYKAFGNNWLALVPGIILAAAFCILGFIRGSALGTLIGSVFVITLIISAITGGNMFQVWNVGDITFTYFQVPQVATGTILTLLVGAVIIGGIKRIGAVAGRIVPFMCFIYILAAAYVLIANIGEIPAGLALIVKSGLPGFLGGQSPDPTGAFLGGTFGYAAMWGIKRALFSSEAGQGSSPIAHSAAKTDEPVREGVVAGLEPFIDTIVVCTLTALVILTSGAYKRESEAAYASAEDVRVVFRSEVAAEIAAPIPVLEGDEWTLPALTTPPRNPTEAESKKSAESGKPVPEWKSGYGVFVYATPNTDGNPVVFSGKIAMKDGVSVVEFDPIPAGEAGAQITSLEMGTVLYHGTLPSWSVETTEIPAMTDDARRIRRTAEGAAGWRDGETVFVIVEADVDPNTGRDLRRISGTVKRGEGDAWSIEWGTLASEAEPFFRPGPDGASDLGIYGDYAGASMTAYAFDRTAPGLGQFVVTIAAWLFALSTMISWSYYGEQGVYFFFGFMGERGAKPFVLLYKLIYCLLIFLTGVAAMKIFPGAADTKIALIGTDAELDTWTTLGLGVMLVANIPIMLIFGSRAMKAYHEYIGRLKSGKMESHAAPDIAEVMEGHDVE